MEKEHLIGVVNRARQGDESAKEALYLDTYKSTYRFALRMVRNTEDAEDITQEVFITVCNKITELREPAAFYKWVNQITVNKCNELFRKYKGIAFLDDEDAIMTMVDDDPMNLPDKAIDDEATRQIIMDVIENLPDGQRSCVLYYYYSQLTIAQIADILEISEGTVKSRLSTARAKIRAALEEKEKKEGIKLYGIPLALTPILQQSIDQMFVPDGLAERMWENIKQSVLSNTPTNSGSGGDSGSGSANNSGSSTSNASAVESASNASTVTEATTVTSGVSAEVTSTASATVASTNAGAASGASTAAVATAAKAGVVLSAKAIAAIIGGVVLVAAVVTSAIFWPQISERFSKDNNSLDVVEESSNRVSRRETDTIDAASDTDEDQPNDEAQDIEDINYTEIVTIGSWREQATGRTFTFFDDNTVAITTSDGALMATAGYSIENDHIGISLNGEEMPVSIFNAETEVLTIAYSDGPVILIRTPRISVPSSGSLATIFDFEGVWMDSSGVEYAFHDDNSVTVTKPEKVDSGKYEIYANSISITISGAMRVMLFEFVDDELTLTFQGQQTHLSRVIPYAIPPGRYYNNNRMEFLGDVFIPFIDINSDGTFRRLNLNYVYRTWFTHWSESILEYSYDENYWEGTYVVINDTLIFTPLSVTYLEGSVARIPITDSFSTDEQFTFMFDGTNLVGKSWTERDGVELFNGTNADTMHGYPADAVFVRIEDTSIPEPKPTPVPAPIPAPIKTNDEIWIRISRISKSGSNTTLVFDLIEPMSFSLEEFEQLKSGATINKYTKSFTLRQLSGSEREYFYGDMGYAITTQYDQSHYDESNEIEYSCIEEDGKIVLIGGGFDYMEYTPMGIVQRGLSVTLTSETTVNIFKSVYNDALGFSDIDTSGTYPFEPSILEDLNEWYADLNEFRVTVRNGVWVNMWQVFYSQ